MNKVWIQNELLLIIIQIKILDNKPINKLMIQKLHNKVLDKDIHIDQVKIIYLSHICLPNQVRMI